MVRAIDRKLLRDLKWLRWQALAIALVIAAGVAVVIMSFGAMRSLQETREAYYERYRFAHVFASLKRAPEDVAHEISTWPHVAAVETRISEYVTLDIAGLDRPAVGLLVSLPANGAAHLNAIVLRQGRLPRADRSEAVVSENMALAHGFEPGATISAIINGRKREITVTGIALSPEFIYAMGPGQIVPDDKTFGILWMDREQLEAAFDLDGAFNAISIGLMRGADENDVIDRLDVVLAPYGGTGAYGRDDQLSHAFVEQELQQLWTMATLIPPIFLAVAAFLINVILSRLIETEREQIGLLKAFGYSSLEVGWHYAKLALAIVVAGLAIGTAAGLWLGVTVTEMYQQYFRFPFLYFRMDPVIFVAAYAVTVGAALAGTWRGVAVAVRLSPAIAMQPAPPTVYRRSLVERLHLTRYVSAPTHMIVRHIERWPWRAGFTSVGVALSGALLISSFYFFDAIDEMLDSYYFRDNRQDATVEFLEPLHVSAVAAIGRMPGVRAAEPFREVPVRLRHRHHNERVTISAVARDTRLRRFTDMDGSVFDIPPEGLLLGDQLANLLDVRAGDILQLEVLEGRRDKREVRVAAIVSEYIGLTAYMDVAALERLIDEGPAVSGARIVVDPAGTQAFYATLKETPATGIVVLRAPAIRSFRETLAQNMLVVIGFYVGFAAVIIFGVVYNTARVTLSERARELASMRVLGFTRGEVAYVLLGELAILVFLALPIACVAGYALAGALGAAMATDLFRIPFVIARSTYGEAALVILAAAALSGFAVAWRIARLDLIAVLKTRD